MTKKDGPPEVLNTAELRRQIPASGAGDPMPLTRQEAYALCPPDCYVEWYGRRWHIVPFIPVKQPEFFDCVPASSQELIHTSRVAAA